MQVVNLANRFVTIELSPEDCYLLHRALNHAAANDFEWKHHQTLQAFSALFEVAALATGLYSVVHPETSVNIEGLRSGKLIDSSVTEVA